MKNSDLKHKSFTVIGAARSGVAAALLLRSKGFDVFISDNIGEDKINSEDINKLKNAGINYEFGVHSGKVFEADAIILSPGVPQNSEVVRTAQQRGLKIYSEIEAAYWFCEGKITAITGTNGKTTTTTLVGELLKNGGLDEYTCGNIGLAFSDIVSNMNKKSIAVLEVSSFQLDNIDSFRPDVSVLLNITPDHLDRYEHDINKYIYSKFRVIENQNMNDLFIYNFDDNVVKDNLKKYNTVRSVPFSIKNDISGEFKNCCFLKGEEIILLEDGNEINVIGSKELVIKGPHNIYNSMASILCARFFNVNIDIIRDTLRNFQGVEHRIEFVRELNGIKFYNDSKATNVDSVWYALQGFREPIVLILGGRDKGNDYGRIEKEVKSNVKKIIAVGESGWKVYDFFASVVPVEMSEDFNDCIIKAYRSANTGDVVLLSPACASFDMFTSYEHRGKEFKRIVSLLN